ncbi:hypothetical protein FB45DRAFT_243249 [Roridomyces roridus]|uniref:DUF4189 domain-containing protein n=1 Tax=Roridomyces roridus TaxID=1738132 RepID=A0AAD7FED3_9AGAR|nr:hypothetical protein FB45DRAFT_243249 [Roridomyces roridus]
MRSQAFLLLLTASASVTVFGSPICASTDKAGSPLVGSSAITDGSFAECDYKGAGPCQFFAADGAFSSGSSDCPAGINAGANNAPAPAVITHPVTFVPVPSGLTLGAQASQAPAVAAADNASTAPNNAAGQTRAAPVLLVLVAVVAGFVGVL